MIVMTNIFSPHQFEELKDCSAGVPLHPLLDFSCTVALLATQLYKQAAFT